MTRESNVQHLYFAVILLPHYIPGSDKSAAGYTCCCITIAFQPHHHKTFFIERPVRRAKEN